MLRSWILLSTCAMFSVKAQYLLSGGICGGGYITRVHPAYNLQECEFNCDKDGKYYDRPVGARSFSHGSFFHGRGDCLCSTQCSCLDSRRPKYEVSLSSTSQLEHCEQGTVEGMHLDACHYFTDATWTKTTWVQYECNPQTGGITQLFYEYQTYCRQKQHIQRSYDFPMHECFEHFPGEWIKVSFCSQVDNQLRFTYCNPTTEAPTPHPTTTAQPTAQPTTRPTPHPTQPIQTTPEYTEPVQTSLAPTHLPSTFWWPYPSSSPTVNFTAYAYPIEEDRNGDSTEVGGTLTLVVLLSVIAVCILCWCIFYFIKAHLDKKNDKSKDFEHILLEEETTNQNLWLDVQSSHSQNSWQSPIRGGDHAYDDRYDYNYEQEQATYRRPLPTLDLEDTITDTLDPKEIEYLQNLHNDQSLNDRYLISTLPVTPLHKRPDFWKRDPSMSETSYNLENSPRGSRLNFHMSQDPPMSTIYSADDVEGYSSERLTSSDTDGRSTHRSPSGTPGGDNNNPEKHQPYGFTKRYSLRALSPKNNKWNGLNSQVVMSKQLAKYLTDRKLARFIPDLEAFGVARACDLLELHRSDINSFSVEPSGEERNKLENLFLLGAIE